MNQTVSQPLFSTQEENDLIKRFSQRVVKERMGNFHRLKRSVNGEIIYPEVDCNTNSNWGNKLLQKSELIQQNKLVNVQSLKEDVVYYNGSEHNLLYRKRMKFPKINSNTTATNTSTTNRNSNNASDDLDNENDFDLNNLVSVKDILTPIASLSDVVNKPSVLRTFSNPILDKLSLKTVLMIEKEQDSVIRYSKLLDTFLGDYPKPLIEANLKLPDYDHNLILPDDDDEEDEQDISQVNEPNQVTTKTTSDIVLNGKDTQDTITDNNNTTNDLNKLGTHQKQINTEEISNNKTNVPIDSKTINKDDEENVTTDDLNTTIEEDNKADDTKLNNQNILSNITTAIDDQTKLHSDDTAATTITEPLNNTTMFNSNNSMDEKNTKYSNNNPSNEITNTNNDNKLANNNSHDNSTPTTPQMNMDSNTKIDNEQIITRNDPFFALPEIDGKDAFSELVDNMNDMEIIEQMEITRQMAQIALQRNEEYIRNLQKIRNFFDNAERIRERIYSWGRESAGIQDEDVTIPNVLRVVKRGLISATTNRTLTGATDDDEIEENQ